MQRMAFDLSGQGEEAALLARYAGGDVAAARILIDRLAPKALSVAWRFLGDRAEAEDVVQEAMLRLWEVAPDWQPGRARVATWLHRVVVNLCTDRTRKRRDLSVAVLPERAADARPPTASLVAAARRRALAEALAGLPERQRQAVLLRDIEGLANGDIAAILGVSVDAVESLVARGRRGLRHVLGARRDELGFTDD